MSFFHNIYNLFITTIILFAIFSIVSEIYYIYHHGFHYHYNTETGEYKTKEKRGIISRNFLYNELTT